MRIISKFKDYYDSVMKMGQDTGLTYLRKTETAKVSPKFLKLLPEDRLTSVKFGKNDAPEWLEVKGHTIGFCGKLYPMFELSTWVREQEQTIQRKAFCYNLTEIDAFIEANYKKAQKEAYYSLRPLAWRDRSGWHHNRRQKDFERYFSEMVNKVDLAKDFFLEMPVPTFVVQSRGVVLNPNLKDLEFYRIFDAYQTFQEIQMFLGGMAMPDKPIPHVSDLDLLQGKGFDKKWSFRKPPSDGS